MKFIIFVCLLFSVSSFADLPEVTEESTITSIQMNNLIRRVNDYPKIMTIQMVSPEGSTARKSDLNIHVDSFGGDIFGTIAADNFTIILQPGKYHFVLPMKIYNSAATGFYSLHKTFPLAQDEELKRVHNWSNTSDMTLGIIDVVVDILVESHFVIKNLNQKETYPTGGHITMLKPYL